MVVALDTLMTLVSLVFLAILGAVAGVAVPGLFIAVVAPWLDRFLPMRRKPS
jgi:hypothetical protein